MTKQYIYKLYVGPFVYWGRTNNLKSRYKQHEKACYNKSKKSYHRKIYKVIRSFTGYNKSKFKDYVKMKKVYECNNYELIKDIEHKCINRKLWYCLNSLD